ncbi:hypothetical protein ACH5RR_004293 [Cinchona calisaya]|uniref:C3H1-type domain-containing protein n=1 Tax=Cinchona calisaya TaxID=153742 RepID=A0ABD3AX80_9GENT
MSFPTPPPPPPPQPQPQPPPPPPFMQRSFSDGDVGGFQPGLPLDHPGYPLGHENLDPDLHFEHATPFKRPRNVENDSAISAPLPPLINPRMNPPVLPGSKGTSHIFYKTRICAKFLEGKCKNGENCTFAHGVEDMREPPPNWQEIVREKEGSARTTWTDDQRLIYSMKLCKKFYNGEECPYGDKCNFLHERPTSGFGFDEWPKPRTDMPKQGESSVINTGTRGSAIGNASDYDQQEASKPVNTNMNASRAKTVVWKSKLCSKWEITGHCPFGERCHFAHGQSELNVSTAQLDGELMANSNPTQTKPVELPVFDSSPANVEVGAAITEVRRGINFPRWRPKRRINTIYADWLGDQTPPRGSPDEVED